MRRDRTREVHEPRVLPHPVLHAASPSSGQARPAHRTAGAIRRERLRQRRRLVVAPPQEPPSVRRHRHGQHPLPQDRRARPRHPPRRGPHEVQPVAMLQRQHQSPPVVAVGQRRAPPAPGPRDRHALVADVALGRGPTIGAPQQSQTAPPRNGVSCQQVPQSAPVVLDQRRTGDALGRVEHRSTLCIRSFAGPIWDP